MLRGIENQIDKGIDEEDTRNVVHTIKDYFENIDLHVDLSENVEVDASEKTLSNNML